MPGDVYKVADEDNSKLSRCKWYHRADVREIICDLFHREKDYFHPCD